MTETPSAGTAYPFAAVATVSGLAASGLQFPAMATAATRTELDRLMRDQPALYLLEHRLHRTFPERPRAEGVTYAELARTMAGPRSVVTRLADPFYFGHTTASPPFVPADRVRVTYACSSRIDAYVAVRLLHWS